MSYDSTADTLLHIKRVNELLIDFATEILRRAKEHDESKLSGEEKEGFDRATPRLKELTYGSEEYKMSLEDLQVALDHHYANNSHHPEHYENGVNDFNLYDLVEMFLDWKAATERHADGDIMTSITKNESRFSIAPQISSIFRNHAKLF